MTDDDREENDHNQSNWLDAVPGPEIPLPDAPILDDLAAELQAGIEGAMPDPDDIEAALNDVSIPEVGDLDVEAAVRPGEAVPDEQADAIVDAGEQAVDIAVEGSEEAATVLVDTGGEVIEVAVESGGEAAAEATAEVLAAALDGL